MGIGWPPSPNAVESEEKFREAIEAIEKRTPVSREEFDRLDRYERENAFTASRVAEARVLQNVLDALQTSVRDGTDFAEFKDSVGAQLVESWGGEIPGRIENIFRTQSMTAYNEGRHAAYSSPTVKAARPYLRFDASMDDRTTDECAECDGTILPADDPFWLTHHPPLHFACRSVLVPLSAEEAGEEGIDDEAPDVDAAEGFGDEPSRKGDDWDFDLSNLDPELRAMVKDDIE
jgi:SPP1 gp7 family putative phage head morphogenesis protein